MLAQWVQKQLDDLCIATPPAKRDVMEDFIKTHRDTCARVGVRLAPEDHPPHVIRHGRS